MEFDTFCNSADEFLRRELWMQLAADGSKYAFLLHVHPAFGMADIGFMECSWGMTRTLCKFLCSAHNLEIETGRYARPPISRSARFCAYCSRNGVLKLGDEWHALDECPNFQIGREKVITRFLKIIPDVERSTCVVSQVLRDLDQYPRRVRHDAWKTIAVFVNHIHNIMKPDRQV